MSVAIDATRFLVSQGIAVAPIGPHGPPLADASADAADLARWERELPGVSFVAPTGRERGLLVLDVREKLLKKIEYAIPDLLALPTLRVRRKPGEVHVWFSIAVDGDNIGAPQFGRFKKRLAPKYLARVPGGLHSRSGLMYRWDEGHGPNDCGLMRLPREWERTLVRASAADVSDGHRVATTAPPVFDPKATSSWRYIEEGYGY